MKISVKLIGGFFVVALLVGFVGFFGIVSINNIQENNQIGKEITEHMELLSKSLVHVLQLIETENLDDYYSIKSNIENIRKEFDQFHEKNEKNLQDFGIKTHQEDIDDFTKISNGIIAVHKEKLIQNKEFIEKQSLEKDLRYLIRTPSIALNDAELSENVIFMEYYSKERSEEHTSELQSH